MYIDDDAIHLDETYAIKFMQDYDGHWYIVNPGDEDLFHQYVLEMDEDGESIVDSKLFTSLGYDISRYMICL